MICYQDTNDPIKCNFCNSSEDCEHLLALYDETFNSIEGGILIESDTIEILLSNFFIDLIKLKGFSSPLKLLKNDLIADIWNEIVISKDCYLVDGDFDESEFYLPNHYRYMFDKLEEIIYPEYAEFEGGPGQSSLYKVFYTDKSSDVIAKLEQLIAVEIHTIRIAL